MSNNRELGYVVGAVAGYFTGGASYIALGATIGGVVGGMLDPNVKTQGPRLDDLKVQMSTYGIGIPRLYGTERISPNVVWSTDKIETSNTVTSGKGGGGTENTSFRYYVHMRLLLCETPRDGAQVQIAQMFQDGKLIYDARSGVPLASALASAENPYAFFTLYQGDADQLPDAVEELAEGGPGSVPAYRGVVSISMKAVECPGGRVPQFSLVLSVGGVTASVLESYTDVPSETPDNSYAYAVIRQNAVWHFATTGHWYDDTFLMHIYYGGPGYFTKLRNVPLPTAANVAAPIPLSGDGNPSALYPYNNGLLKIDLTDGSTQVPFIPDEFTPPGWHGHGSNRSAGFDASTGHYILRTDEGPYPSSIWIIRDGVLILGGAVPGVGGAVAIQGQYAYCLGDLGGNIVLARYNSEDGTLVDTSVGPAYNDGSSSITFSALHPSSDGLYAWAREVGAAKANLWFIDYATGTGVWTLINDQVQTFTTEKISAMPTTIYADKLYAIIGPSIDSISADQHNYAMVRHAAVVLSEAKVSDIIAAECEIAGETRYDVSAIPDTDTVRGYKIGAPASARANIDPFLPGFQIFVIDEDGAIKFKKYADITSIATIAFDELGQAEAGSEPSDAMPLNRTQEIDMPRSVSVSYIEPLNDYQVATEKEIRQVTEATEDMLVQLPIALLSSDQAKRAATSILFSRWRSQNTRSLTACRKYAFLSPGDGVTVEYPQGTFRLWRITRMTDTGAVIEMGVEPGDASLYTQTAVGATGYVGQEVAPLAAPLRQQLLDIPILRDEDNNAGIYDAIDSMSAMPANGELLAGGSDATLALVGAVAASAPIGFAETVLGTWTPGLVDETNLVTVSLGDDVFDSVTRDILLSGGGEYWALGAPGRWEIGASASAASLGDGRYILSRHLRGLFGTEQYASTHTASDTIVLLRIAGMLRPSMGVSDLGLERSYRAVPKGQRMLSVTSQTYVNTGEGLKPLSPVNLRRTGTNDLTVDRRSRLAMNNMTGSLPLGESSEAYRWEFYTTSGFTALIGSTTTSAATITAAQQTAIGVTPTVAAYVRVAQISDSVGPGHQLQATA